MADAKFESELVADILVAELHAADDEHDAHAALFQARLDEAAARLAEASLAPVPEHAGRERGLRAPTPRGAALNVRYLSGVIVAPHAPPTFKPNLAATADRALVAPRLHLCRHRRARLGHAAHPLDHRRPLRHTDGQQVGGRRL